MKNKSETRPIIFRGIRVLCNDCGFHGEVNEDYSKSSVRTQCPKCGLLGLEYDKKTERTISGRERVKELLRQSKTKREIRLMLRGYLSIVSIDDYYNLARKELGLPRLISGVLGNKNAKRPLEGETRHCLDCGIEIYVTRYRIEHAKNENVGRRCRPCSLKWIARNRRQNPIRITVPAIKRYITWISETYSKDKPEQVKYGIILACKSMVNFIESRNKKSIGQ